MKSTATGIKRLFLASKYSWQGLLSGLKSEAALRQEGAAMLILLPATFLFDVSALEQALMIFSVLLVFIVELLNTAVEVAIDRISPEFHELSGKAKDIASAAVFFSLFTVVFVWAVILWPR